MLRSDTSLVAIVCREGVVMGADRRVTAGGHIVMSKDEQKVAQINDYLVVSWTGNASDAVFTQKLITAELRLKQLKTGARPTVKEAANLIGMMLYRNIRTPSMIPSIVGTLVGGLNEDGTTDLYTIEPAGGVYKVKEYDANFSSGMPFILGFLERMYKRDISIQEAVELAKECLKASTERDPASGNGIDIFSITKSGIQHAVAEKIIPQFK